MIDEKALTKWKELKASERLPIMEECWWDFVDTLERALKVVKAAKELRNRAYLMCGYKIIPGDPPAIIQLKDLEISLIPFEGKGDKHE